MKRAIKALAAVSLIPITTTDQTHTIDPEIFLTNLVKHAATGIQYMVEANGMDIKNDPYWQGYHHGCLDAIQAIKAMFVERA